MLNFGAKLTVNNNVYRHLKTDSAKAAVQKTVEEYKDFVKHPNFERLTQEETIELRRGKYRGYALELEITGPRLDEPYVTGVYTRKQEPDIKAADLIFQTLLYLCHRTGETQRYSESSFEYVKRVLFNDKLKK